MLTREIKILRPLIEKFYLTKKIHKRILAYILISSGLLGIFVPLIPGILLIFPGIHLLFRKKARKRFYEKLIFWKRR